MLQSMVGDAGLQEIKSGLLEEARVPLLAVQQDVRLVEAVVWLHNRVSYWINQQAHSKAHLSTNAN